MKKKSNAEDSIVKRTDGRCMGHYTLDGKRFLPLAIQVHHAVCDGICGHFSSGTRMKGERYKPLPLIYQWIKISIRIKQKSPD